MLQRSHKALEFFEIPMQAVWELPQNRGELSAETGGAAALIDPHSPAELRAALDRLLTSPATRAQLAAAGRTQAQRFRWAQCARRSVEFFEQTLG